LYFWYDFAKKKCTTKVVRFRFWLYFFPFWFIIFPGKEMFMTVYWMKNFNLLVVSFSAFADYADNRLLPVLQPTAGTYEVQ